MLSSIKKKMFIAFSAFVLIIVFFIWILNYYFVDEYYLAKKKNNILEEIENIDELYDGDIENINNVLLNAQSIYGGNFIIFDSLTGDIKYTSYFGQMMGQNRGNGYFNSKSLLKMIGISEQALSNISFTKEFKVSEMLNGDKNQIIIMTGIFTNGDYVMFISPVEVISKHIKLTSDFYIYTGVGAIILGLIAAYFISVRMTKPVLILTKKAKQMSKLDFTNNYEVKSNDEIGQLSKVMSELSAKLDNAITDLNNANETLQADIDKEKELEKIRREFVSNVSHELKTPISLIQGYAEGLQDNITQDKESKDYYVKVIRDEAVKMDKLVKDLLELSKFESGKQKLKIKNVDLLNIIPNNVKKFQTFAENSGIKITLNSNIDKNDSNVMIDKEKIEQVFNNLLSNAVKYTEGQIKEVKVNVNNKGKDRIEVRIFNTSKGIPEENLTKVWSRFYKLDKSRNRTVGGTGLGLAIVKKILQLHDSSFGVVNVENGVEFYFDLKKSKFDLK